MTTARNLRKTLQTHDGIIKFTNDHSSFQAFKEYNERLRAGNLKATGENMRRMGSLPAHSYLLLKKLDPELFNDKEKLRDFFNKYPVFKGSDGRL